MGLPFVAGRANVKEFAQKSKLSVEMAARKLRHDFFARVAKERKIRVVALAHHADDQVELFFLRVLRGAGGEGLAGMKWRSPSPVDSKYHARSSVARRDQSRTARVRRANTKSVFAMMQPTRRLTCRAIVCAMNCCRCCGHYQPALAKTVLRLMEIVGAESDLVGETARQWLEIGCRSRGDEAHIKSGKRKAKSGKLETPSAFTRLRRDQHVVSCSFASLPVAVQRRVLQLQLAELGVTPDFELIEQLRESPGKHVSVSSGVSIARDADGKLDCKKHAASGFNANVTAVNLAGRAGDVEFDGVRFGWRARSGGKFCPATRTESV